MKKSFWRHLLFLLFTALAAWVWTQIPLTGGYTAQLIALLAVAYLLALPRRALSKEGRFWPRNKPTNSFEGVVLTAIVLLIVFSTGGAGSPMFFLVYFLMFGLAFVWEPQLVLNFSALLAPLLFFSTVNISQTQSLINLGSVFFIAPLSWFFGRQFLDNLTAQKWIKLYQEKWSEDEKQLEKVEGKVLIWLSTRFKPGMTETLDKLSLLLVDLSQLTPLQKSRLKRIRRLSKKLLNESERLSRLVESRSQS